MGNSLFSYPDYTIPSRVHTPLLYGGNWALPLVNLQDPLLSAKAVSVDAQEASTKFDADLITTRAIRTCALLNHNCSLDATIRILFSLVSDFATTVYDSGEINIWPQYAEGSLPTWHESYITRDISAEVAVEIRPNYVHVIPDIPINARYCRIEVSDTGNADGHVEFGRCFIGPGWTPTHNYIYGRTLGWDDASTRERSLGGVDYYEEREPRRVATMSIPDNLSAETMVMFFEMQRKLGTTGELLLVLDDDDEDFTLQQRSFLCTMSELSPLENTRLDVEAISLKFEEIL